jgi:hypothetical protein
MAAGSAYGLHRGGYFRADRMLMEAGRIVAENSSRSDLITVAIEGRTTGPTDPRLLYWADRKGFTAPLRDLDDARWKRCRAEGINMLAVLTRPDAPLDMDRISFVQPADVRRFEVCDAAGGLLGHLAIIIPSDEAGGTPR